MTIIAQLSDLHLSDDDPRPARWLETTLAAAPDAPDVVAMHHPPYRLGITGLDAMGHADPDRLADVLRRHPQVLRVITGHAHAASAASFAGTVAIYCPSTYRQMHLDLRPGAPVTLSDAPAGFALHVIEDGTAVTHFRTVGEAPR